jgi:hypothetical protein
MSVTTDSPLPQPASTGALRPSLPVWGLFGRTLLVALGNLLIVPAPWTVPYLYRFLCEHVTLPDGRRLKFTGQPGDIWYVLVGVAALPWVHTLAEHAGFPQHLGLIWMLALAALTVLLFRWFCANLKSEDGTLSVAFEGGIWPYIGWYILLLVSFVTIVGWAWVLKYMMQWICRNVRGTVAFDFTATGLAILWRAVGAILLCVLIIPIPWVHRWLASWLVSQIIVVDSSRA